ncbi:aldose epimerase family protein [Flavobacterium sp. DG1-102-2]|uniref:aldose epimerase family protein n=1 Tax=Flavobacterium sp. DG1-102-2 TaxID=3081663 RepID=UPI002948F55F|nr:aldose epimerase family protein [Flavobacterium sp. DG1-102-2]MDV6169770.1 aldose epimerase family protein [Flavobacterium sp. DG1-102-2]
MIEYKNVGEYGGKGLFEFRITNDHGNYVDLINYGAIVKSIVVPDRYGEKANVVLGYPTTEGYITDPSYMGATVGPFANRIANAQFEIDGKIYSLDTNDGVNNNHSGSAGFHNKVFDFTISDSEVIFFYKSIDSAGGFPGSIETRVTYKWTDDNELIIDFKVMTDKPVPVNPTNHSYFNLSGCDEKIQAHRLIIKGSNILESSPDYIPTGKIIPAGSHFFNGQQMGDAMKDGGINNYYIFDSDIKRDEAMCTLWEGNSGRKMETFTTYPGVQLYTGDFLGGDVDSAHGKPYTPFDGLCLECQLYPDSPNHKHFPETILRPGQICNHSVTYKFGLIA